jgi:hypothetical protein
MRATQQRRDTMAEKIDYFLSREDTEKELERLRALFMENPDKPNSQIGLELLCTMLREVESGDDYSSWRGTPLDELKARVSAHLKTKR